MSVEFTIFLKFFVTVIINRKEAYDLQIINVWLS